MNEGYNHDFKIVMSNMSQDLIKSGKNISDVLKLGYQTP